MARRIPREFVPIDLNMPRDGAIRRAGQTAELLFIRGLIYIKQTGTDGFIPEFDLSVLAAGIKGAELAARQLVANGLWERSPGGWSVPSWLKWNKSQAEIAEDKVAKRDAAILTNHKRYHGKQPQPDCVHCEQVRGVA